LSPGVALGFGVTVENFGSVVAQAASEAPASNTTANRTACRRMPHPFRLIRGAKLRAGSLQQG
jgi:hypothetical protein